MGPGPGFRVFVPFVVVDFNGNAAETANTMQVHLRSKFNHEGRVEQKILALETS